MFCGEPLGSMLNSGLLLHSGRVRPAAGASSCAIYLAVKQVDVGVAGWTSTPRRAMMQRRLRRTRTPTACAMP